jgi:hypothetical protein
MGQQNPNAQPDASKPQQGQQAQPPVKQPNQQGTGEDKSRTEKSGDNKPPSQADA